jgi:thiamine monophosphate kinase
VKSREDPLKERKDLRVLLKRMPRSIIQVNDLFESDVEIVRNSPTQWFVSSIDSISDEISNGLYKDPQTWGWMTVMSSVSDLAASGCAPLGLLLSTQWALKTSKKTQAEFFKGAADALRACGVSLLGGDSGFATNHVFTSSISGQSSAPPLTRLGVRPGDFLILIGNGSLGAGPSLSLSFLNLQPSVRFSERNFRPNPQPTLSGLLRRFASASIDTSDGLATSVAILSELNGVGFELFWQTENLNSKAVSFCNKSGLPLPLLWMNDLGDLQTLFCVPEKNLKKLRSVTHDFSIIGRAHRGRKITMVLGAQKTELPMAQTLLARRDLNSIRRLNLDLVRHFKKLGF